MKSRLFGFALTVALVCGVSVSAHAAEAPLTIDKINPKCQDDAKACPKGITPLYYRKLLHRQSNTSAVQGVEGLRALSQAYGADFVSQGTAPSESAAGGDSVGMMTMGSPTLAPFGKNSNSMHVN